MNLLIRLLRFDFDRQTVRHWVGVSNYSLRACLIWLVACCCSTDMKVGCTQSIRAWSAARLQLASIQMHGCATPTEEPPRSTVQPESYGQAGSSLGWRQFDMNTVAEGDPGYMA